ncbi:Cyclopropane fatty-acyl-phospholipid synthase [Cetobacterium ceti]|uniref:Cyclopropane fatty-acyl-phospholipid synthase n=1 Tax=Cetobacterium ceti TaxID=180163 RepID=A0A1T4PZ70_9FUSO|nr:class I SAM-dependent methyltransferase [Cetobacterium ceti]SJZ96607.1 Cyclopropane fatty-acyl-phospholipid synthase [Cetobacterium ceti]
MYNNFAKIYDKFMKYCDYDQWSSYIKDKIEEYHPQGKTLLDLGCGTGETLIRLKENFQCSGLDLSKEMLEIAHKKLKNKGVNLFMGDMREFNTGEKYDIIISLFDTVNHLTSIEDLEDLFSAVKGSLNENGIYIFDVVDRKFMEAMFPGGIYYDERKDMTIIWEHSREDDLDFVEANFFVKNKNNTYDKYKEYYEKKIFDRSEIEKAVKKNDLSLLTVAKNDKIAGERYFYVVKKS